jgi:hypothetical protein
LSELVKHKSATVRRNLAFYLSRELPPEFSKSVSAELLRDKAASVRIPDDPRAKVTVLQALDHASPFVRREALQALIAIKGLSASDLALIIKDRENDADKDVARWSEIALRNIRLRREV